MNRTLSTQDQILDAAEIVAVEGGAAHLTLDAVSKRAGISKGGLLYHFKNKDELVTAMIKRLIKYMEDARDAELEKLPQGSSRELKAHIMAWNNQAPRVKKIAAGLMAAASLNPDILKTAKPHFDEVLERFIRQDANPEKALVIFMAIEGVRFFELLGLVEPTDEQRRKIVDVMIKILED